MTEDPAIKAAAHAIVQAAIKACLGDTQTYDIERLRHSAIRSLGRPLDPDDAIQLDVEVRKDEILITPKNLLTFLRASGFGISYEELEREKAERFIVQPTPPAVYIESYTEDRGTWATRRNADGTFSNTFSPHTSVDYIQITIKLPDEAHAE